MSLFLAVSALGLLVLSVAMPLFTYATSLALFGLAHVAWEVRYVDQRFGRRVAAGLLWAVLAALAGVVAVRSLRVAGLLEGAPPVGAELALGAALALVVAPALRASALGVGALVAVAGSLAAGAALAPTTTLLVVAVLHNLTPLGFLMEAVRGPHRTGRPARMFHRPEAASADRRAPSGSSNESRPRRASGTPPGAPRPRRPNSLAAPRSRPRAGETCGLALAAALLVGLPLLVATGLPLRLFLRLGLFAPEVTWLPAGPLFEQLGAYLPRSVHLEPWALHAFSGAVLAQCLHYLFVIGVLPRLVEPGARGLVPWPTPARFAGLVAVATGALLVGYFADFGQARSLYGIAATFHVWLEVPVLLLALAPGRAPTAAVA